MASRTKFRLNDRVHVPMPLFVGVGRVVDVYGPSKARRVVVDVEFHGASGEVLHTMRVPFDEAEVELVNEEAAAG